MPNSPAKQKPNGRTRTSTAQIGFRSLFGPSSLQECPDWRYQTAAQIAQQAIDNDDHRPPTHADAWIQDAARIIHAALRNDPAFRPTVRQWHILEAFTLKKRGLLAVSVLEARLASRQRPEEIARLCSLQPETIAAYTALLCDLSEPCRWQTWGRQRLMPSLGANKHVAAIDALLQRTLMLGGLEALERSIAVLCRLEGPTLADGLPERTAAGFLQQWSLRLDVALAWLPMNRTNARLLDRLETARRNRPGNHRLGDEVIDVGCQVLAKAKIPKPLRKAIAQLHGFCQPPEAAAMQHGSNAEGVTNASSTTNLMFRDNGQS